MSKSSFPRELPVLTKTAEYALRALLVLAGRRGQPVPAAVIARQTAAPTNYLSKTLLVLARSGLIRSSPGRTGGFELAEQPDQITIARIADLFTEPRWSLQCLLGTGACNPDEPCAAHRRWRELTKAVRDPLATTTLAALLADADGDDQTAKRPITAGAAGTI